MRAGQLWRAKEILAGRIASGPFDADTYEEYGTLLLRMGDDLQAGRYLFLCGQRRPEYQAAIELFVSRFGRAGWRPLVVAFPAAAKRCSWAELPTTVREELRAAGMPAQAEGRILSKTLRSYPTGGPSWAGCLTVGLAVIALGLLLAWIIAQRYEA